MKFLQSFCVVDSSLRILWVGGDWDEFARRNGGEAALANNILSTRLTAHIVDLMTADKVLEMVQVVIETQRTLRLEYRCDAPHEVRRFLLTIKPMKDGRAIMVHELRDAVQLDPPMQQWHYDPTARTQKCSTCGMVHRAEGWVDPAVSQIEHPPYVGYTTCPTCIARIDAALKAIANGADEADVQDFVFKSGIGIA